MGIELSPKGRKKANNRRKKNNHMPKASNVTIRKADGTVTVAAPLTGSVDQVKKR
jgi:hypothetical protein